MRPSPRPQPPPQADSRAKAAPKGKTQAQKGQAAPKTASTQPAGAAVQKRIAAREAALAEPAYPRPRGAGPTWGTVDFSLKRHVSPHGQVTAVSMMKDEGPFVIEWVAHHLALGFSDLVVYTNDCSDGTDDMLIRLEELGLVHHRRNVIAPGLRPQPSALNHAEAEPVVQLSDWVMVFDADEFLSIRHGDGTLDGLIASAKERDANGIVITWRIFGSGGVVEWSRAPVSEQYLLAAPQDWNKGWGVKTLFQYDPEAWKLGIHRPKLKTRVLKTDFPDKIRWLNGSGRPMEEYFKFRGWRSITRTVGYDWVQLNHYAVKSVDSYALRKLRGNVNNKADKYNSDYWSLQDRNEIRDETMLRYSARRDALIAELLTDPEMKRLHDAALARVENRLNEIRQTAAYTELVEGLAKASQVPLGEIVAKPPQARDPAKIAALMSDVERLRTEKAKAERKAKGKTGGEEADPGSSASEEAPQGLMRLYSAENRDLPLADYAGDWVANHDIALPLDPQIFSATSLALVAKGKFERHLARLLPQMLPQGARVLDLGAGTGFLALHLARRRPDLALVLQEAEPRLQTALKRVVAQNGRDFGPRLQLEDAGRAPSDTPIGEGQEVDPPTRVVLNLSEALLRHRPEVLLLGDGLGAETSAPLSERDSTEEASGLGGLPQAIGQLPLSARPLLVVLHGRALEGVGGAPRAALGQALTALGYHPSPKLESPQILVFDRQGGGASSTI